MAKFSVLLTVLLFFSLKSNSQKPTRVYFHSLKAVVVLGAYQYGDTMVINSAYRLKNYLKSKGIRTYFFDGEKANWSTIKRYAYGANIFAYIGHGGHDANTSGGLVLRNLVSREKVAKELKLHHNALVIMEYVCYAAGSAADDQYTLTLQNVLGRVTNYARPFFKAGAGAYFAVDELDGAIRFLDKFFQGKNIESIFKFMTFPFDRIEIIKPSAIDSTMKIGIASEKINQGQVKKLYNLAFIAPSNFTYKDLKR